MFKGVFTAMITPFNDDLSINYEKLRRNIEFQINSGISGLLALGTTAETPTLTEEEKKKIIDIFTSSIDKRVPLMVGTGCNSTKETIKNTILAEKSNADIALIVTPYYNKPTQEGIYEHFKAIIEATNIDIVVYNIQGRTGRNIETATLDRIAQLPRVIGVKEASGNINQVQDVLAKIKSKKENFNVLSGDDALTLPIMALGGSGVVSVVSNLYPKEISQMVDYGLKGNFEKARILHNKLLPVFRGAFLETNPSPIKAAMKYLGLDQGNVRLPLVELQDKNREELEKIIDNFRA